MVVTRINLYGSYDHNRQWNLSRPIPSESTWKTVKVHRSSSESTPVGGCVRSSVSYLSHPPLHSTVASREDRYSADHRVGDVDGCLTCLFDRSVSHVWTSICAGTRRPLQRPQRDRPLPTHVSGTTLTTVVSPRHQFGHCRKESQQCWGV